MEQSLGFPIDYEIVPGARQVKRVVGFVKRVAMLGTQTELSLSEHIRRPGEIGSVPTVYDQANAIIN